MAERVKAETRTFGTVDSLDFAVRGGRVNPHLARTLAVLHLAPIIVFDEKGKALKGGVAFGFDRALSALVKRTLRFTAGASARAMVVHTGDQAGADSVAARLRAPRRRGPRRARRRGTDVTRRDRVGGGLGQASAGDVSEAIRRAGDPR